MTRGYVRWTFTEKRLVWDAIQNSDLLGSTPSTLLLEAQNALPENRRKTKIAIWNTANKFFAEMRDVDSRVADFQMILISKEELVALIREEVARILASSPEMLSRSTLVSSKPVLPLPTASLPARTNKPAFDVVGLLGSQVEVVKRSVVASKANLRFLTSQQAKRASHLRDRAVLCADFISHSVQTRYQNKGATILVVNGAAGAVINKLMESVRQEGVV